MTHFTCILTGFGVLFLIVCLWMVVYYWLNPHVRYPDGKARITGKCGDTMEICLKFTGDRVVKTSHWTDGCAHSLNCVYAAAYLATGKTPDEIIEIDRDHIKEYVGGLPTDHNHCADLAFETLQAALDYYMLNQKKSRMTR